MNPLLKIALLVIVLAVLVTLVGAIGAGWLLLPGRLLVGMFADVNARSGAVLVVNGLFWLTAFGAWLLISGSRTR